MKRHLSSTSYSLGQRKVSLQKDLCAFSLTDVRTLGEAFRGAEVSVTPVSQSQEIAPGNEGLWGVQTGGHGLGWGAILCVAPPVSSKAPLVTQVLLRCSHAYPEGRSCQLCQGVEEGWAMVSAAALTDSQPWDTAPLPQAPGWELSPGPASARGQRTRRPPLRTTPRTPAFHPQLCFPSLPREGHPRGTAGEPRPLIRGGHTRFGSTLLINKPPLLRPERLSNPASGLRLWLDPLSAPLPPVPESL